MKKSRRLFLPKIEYDNELMEAEMMHQEGRLPINPADIFETRPEQILKRWYESHKKALTKYAVPG